MKPVLKAFVTTLFLSLSLISTQTVAAPGNRTGQWQISLIPSYTDSKTIQFEGGAVADISSHSGFAIGIGYNFSDHVELDFDIGSANANYTGTRVIDDSSNTQERYNGSYYTSHMNLGLTYNFIASRLTPFVKGNLGLNYVDSGIQPAILAVYAGGIPGGDIIVDPMHRPIRPVISFMAPTWVFALILPARCF